MLYLWNISETKKNCELKLTKFLVLGQAFVNYCLFRQVQTNRSNNAIKKRIYTNGIKRNKEKHMSRNKMQNLLELLFEKVAFTLLYLSSTDFQSLTHVQ